MYTSVHTDRLAYLIFAFLRPLPDQRPQDLVLSFITVTSSFLFTEDFYCQDLATDVKNKLTRVHPKCLFLTVLARYRHRKLTKHV